nr:synaptosomal-associated protein 23-like [Misgurnus anguillicaudatus]
MIKAQRNLNDLFKCWGLCLCPCNRLKSIENDQRYEQVCGTEQTDEGLVSSQVTAVHKKRRIFGQSAPPSGPYIKKITNDAREDEMEKNLEQVGSIIGNLKIMAADMGHEFDKQNEIIDRMSSKAEINIHHIDAATKKAEQLIKE